MNQDLKKLAAKFGAKIFVDFFFSEKELILMIIWIG